MWPPIAFAGRLRRRHFLFLNILMGFLSFVVSILTSLTTSMPILLLLVMQVVLTVGLFSTLVRRFHDLNRSGWWALGVAILPILVGIGAALSIFGGFSLGMPQLGGFVALGLFLFFLIVWLLLIFERGTEGMNDFGADPRLA